MRTRIVRCFILLASLLAFGALITPATAAEAPTIQWERLLGGSGTDQAHSIDTTSDGGYILLGRSQSSANGDVTGLNHGSNDLWVVKLGSTGEIQWQKLLGGSGSDLGSAVQQTLDGGYILAGSSMSSRSVDVAGANHDPSGYTFDIWVVKLGSTGEIQWQKLLGGTENDLAQSVQQTGDGGYILVGETFSNGTGDVAGTNHGNWDVWVVKLSGAGAIEWQQLLGGSNAESGYSVQQTADSGYILLGDSRSNASGDVTGTNSGDLDLWIVKLDSAGVIQWQQLLGGTATDSGRSVRQTVDGGYILVGSSGSGASGWDVRAAKLSGTGTIEWQRLLGGIGSANSDFGRSVQPTSDGGYVLLGHSYSSQSGDVTGANHGSSDCWVVKLDGTGTIQWQRLLGGSSWDEGTSIRQRTDGGYTLVGFSQSSVSGDVTGINHGGEDFWVVKLSGTNAIVTVPGGSTPTDTNNDGRYDDVNGNGRADFADVVLYFNQMSWISGNEPVSLFDFNGNGRIDFADVVWLFNHL